MASKYNIVVKAVLNKTDLYKQVKDIETGLKPMNLKVNVLGQTKADSQASIENQLTRWKNKLSSLEATNSKVYGSQGVQNLVKNFEGLMGTYDGTKASRDRMVTELNNITTAFGNQQKGIKNTTKDGYAFGDMLGVAMKKMLLWKLAGDAIFGTLKNIKEGINYITDLNKEMTNIQMVTGMTVSETNDLSASYNQMAKQMGATTLEVTRASTEWFRQGKTVQETSELVRASLMMTKLGNMDSAQATEYLTSTLNGFKLEAKDAEDVISKLVALDNAYATSVSELAEGISRSANSAQLAGVSMEELSSYIAITSDVTRKSAGSIGESYKTIFARMGAVKLGKMFDDEGESISDVDKVLKNVGITLRDSSNSFRPMGDVLDEIAAKWNTLSETEQSAVATTVAGKNMMPERMVTCGVF